MENKVRILSTTVLEPDILTRAGAFPVTVDAVDFIKTEYNDSPETLAAIDEALGTGKVFIFTSANAVRAVARSERAAAHKPKTVFCIGRATKEAILNIWPGVQIAATADNAVELAELILNAGVREAVFFCGKSRLDVLPERLNGEGVKLTQIPVYRTIETPVKLEAVYQGILFYSPSGVRSFFSVNEIAPETVLFAIGETTAKALKSRTTNPILKSDMPDKKQMLIQAVNYFCKQK